MSLQEKIAPNFIPTFSASKLGDLCGSIRESTKFRFLKEFKPFSQYIPKTSNKTSKSSLTKQEKNEIQNSLEEALDYENLKFDDKKVIDSYRKAFKGETDLCFMVQNLLLTDDESESEDESYFTAESDEEKFVKINNQQKEKKIQHKTANASRYVTNMRGRKMEKFILERINREKNLNFLQNKSRKILEFGIFKIVGIIDGICLEEKTILEIKTRNKFDASKETINTKEKRQALVYMHMYDCDKCLFVENGPNGERKETIIEYDEKIFKNDVIKKLEEFCIFARNLTYEELNDLINKYNRN
ncbi:unnamed protein product [Brachionus calyciflorus]|uniref:YqaJ viral recombinase domain-containing protein n=1 Tax=Brachionus calyciflorus TaxID=104777 RepID=A0A813X0K7_9BILA|nr:unnamed protein product [Brachionus calyciflorus]